MLHLPNHCPESWDKMTPTEGGRHCSSCNKVITDFAGKTEEEIIAHMQLSQQWCGRFTADQVSDGTTYGGWQHYFKWKRAVAMLLIGSVFLVSCRQRTSGYTSRRHYHWQKGDLKNIGKKKRRVRAQFLIEAPKENK